MRDISPDIHQQMVEKHGRRVGFEVKRLNHIMVRSILWKLREMNMDESTMMNGWILKYLSEHNDGDVFQRDIEKECGIGKSSVTAIVKQMEKNGFIVREQVPGDARLKKLCLTDKGRETNERINEVFDKADMIAGKGISDEDMKVFYSVIDRIHLNVAQSLCENCDNAEADDCRDDGSCMRDAELDINKCREGNDR